MFSQLLFCVSIFTLYWTLIWSWAVKPITDIWLGQFCSDCAGRLSITWSSVSEHHTFFPSCQRVISAFPHFPVSSSLISVPQLNISSSGLKREIIDASVISRIDTCATIVPEYLFSPQVIILIGNKADLEAQRDVTYEEAKQFAEENGGNFFKKWNGRLTIHVFYIPLMSLFYCRLVLW